MGGKNAFLLLVLWLHAHGQVASPKLTIDFTHSHGQVASPKPEGGLRVTILQCDSQLFYYF